MIKEVLKRLACFLHTDECCFLPWFPNRSRRMSLGDYFFEGFFTEIKRREADGDLGDLIVP